MDTDSQSQKQPIVVWLDVLAFTGLGALALYWSVAPEPNYHTLASLILSYLVLWGVMFLWSHASKTEKANRFLLTTASITLTIGFLELLVLAKVVDFRITLNTPQYEPWRNPNNLLDPKLLHIPKPHVRSVWGGIEYRYDQHGFRNESGLEAADIIVIGDSVIEGPRVSATDVVTSHLARELHSTVANMGESWYGPQQESELIRRYAPLFHPHSCVWNFFEGNDLLDAKRYKEVTKDWENFSKDFHSFRQRSFTKNAVLAVQRILDSLYYGSHDQDQIQEDLAGIFPGVNGKKIRIYFLEQGLPLSKDDEEALQQVRASLAQAYEVCHAIGARFLVVFAPTKFRVYKNFTEFDGNARPRDWVLTDLPKRIEAIVHEELPEGEFLDLTTVFVERAKKGSLVYFPGWDTHWSQEGHRVAASAIADVLTRWDKKGDSAGRP